MFWEEDYCVANLISDAKLFLNVLNANWTKFHDADPICKGWS
jgi:hypothetical protein